MHFSISQALALSACLTTLVSGLRLDSPRVRGRQSLRTRAPRALIRRGEPNTGADLPDTGTHPNQLDQVETAINDALELASYVKMEIASDTTIFPHYFNEADRAEITRIFTSIDNNDQGNDALSNILIQTTDANDGCDGRTLSYLKNGEVGATDPPYIVLCPNAFNKKAVTELNGADPSTDNRYAKCEDFPDNVSYLFNTLGMTLLHEYMHYDVMIASSFGPIVDYPVDATDPNQGYGPVNVYDKLDKGLARTNADSYAYYASHILWKVLCQTDYQAPRAGIDDADPDCGNTACHD